MQVTTERRTPADSHKVPVDTARWSEFTRYNGVRRTNACLNMSSPVGVDRGHQRTMCINFSS